MPFGWFGFLYLYEVANYGHNKINEKNKVVLYLAV